TERAEAGDVIGVHVRVDGLVEPEAQAAEQADISIHLLEDRVDDDRPPPGPLRQKVGEGAGGGVKELLEDHGPWLAPGVPTGGNPGRSRPDAARWRARTDQAGGSTYAVLCGKNFS